jgi:hypothetical protein
LHVICCYSDNVPQAFDFAASQDSLTNVEAELAAIGCKAATTAYITHIKVDAPGQEGVSCAFLRVPAFCLGSNTHYGCQRHVCMLQQMQMNCK